MKIRFSTGDLFGERALLTGEPRVAKCDSALTDVLDPGYGQSRNALRSIDFGPLQG
jgi:hypothetical protein